MQELFALFERQILSDFAKLTSHKASPSVASYLDYVQARYGRRNDDNGGSASFGKQSEPNARASSPAAPVHRPPPDELTIQSIFAKWSDWNG